MWPGELRDLGITPSLSCNTALNVEIEYSIREPLRKLKPRRGDGRQLRLPVHVAVSHACYCCELLKMKWE